MRKILVSAAAVAAIATAAPAFAQAGASDTASASASATIVAPISVDKTQDMAFGIIAANGAAGSVDTAGAGTTPGLLVASTTAVQPATFSVSGEGSLAYTVTLPTSGSVTLTGPGTATMDAALSIDSASRALTAGADSFTVHGLLSVGATQAAGSYTGSFQVSVQYD